MRAILVSRENLPKIEETYFPANERQKLQIDTYLESPKKWYLIRGYVSLRNKYVDWTIFPEYLFTKLFEYDPLKIESDWDQIVRK